MIAYEKQDIVKLGQVFVHVSYNPLEPYMLY
jgi:hypothetical protein